MEKLIQSNLIYGQYQTEVPRNRKRMYFLQHWALMRDFTPYGMDREHLQVVGPQMLCQAWRIKTIL